MNKEIFIVIRSVGEKTEQALLNDLLSLSYVEKEDVALVKEQPFSESVKKTFQLGIGSEKKVLVVLDADLIIIKPNFTYFIDMVCRSHFLVGAQGFCHDFFWKGPRRGGVHCYNIETIRSHIDDLDFDPLQARPETHVKGQLEKITGQRYVIVPYVCCFHGYLQSAKDITRTIYIQSRKSPTINKLILENFTENNELSNLIRATVESGEKSQDAVKVNVVDTPPNLLKIASECEEHIAVMQNQFFSMLELKNVSIGYKKKFSPFYFLSYRLIILHICQFVKNAYFIKALEKLIAFNR